MERVVAKYASLRLADDADDDRYRAMDGAEKLQVLLELILPEDPDEAVIQRSARVYPLAQPRGR
jgi:hypothetical protein